MSARISRMLKERLRAVDDDEPIDVVVELQPHDLESDDAVAAIDKAAWLRQSFEEKSEPIVAKVESLGGHVNEGLWLDATLRVSVSRGGVRELAEESGVSALDVPRTVTEEHPPPLVDE